MEKKVCQSIVVPLIFFAPCRLREDKKKEEEDEDEKEEEEEEKEHTCYSILMRKPLSMAPLLGQGGRGRKKNSLDLWGGHSGRVTILGGKRKE